MVLTVVTDKSDANIETVEAQTFHNSRNHTSSVLIKSRALVL